MSGTRVGIRQVAAAAGVSVTTVSHVLNDVEGKRITEETRRRVRQTAETLGYSPNRMAQGLRLQRSQLIALVGDELATTPYAGKMILGAQETANAHDALLVVVSTGRDPGLEDREIRMLLQRQVDGILYATMYHRRVLLPKALRGVPVVLLDATTDGDTASSVVPDEVRGGWDAADVLVTAGHRRCAFINNEDDIPAADGRRRGFLDRLALAGIAADNVPVVSAASITDGGYRAGRELLGRSERPTAIFCFNDRMAMGLYRAAAEVGLRIPEDLSVIGFDDQELIASGLYPGLTTIALPHYAMGAWATEQLYAQIDAPDGEPPPVVHHVIAGPVVVRASVAPPLT